MRKRPEDVSAATKFSSILQQYWPTYDKNLGSFLRKISFKIILLCIFEAVFHKYLKPKKFSYDKNWKANTTNILFDVKRYQFERHLCVIVST